MTETSTHRDITISYNGRTLVIPVDPDDTRDTDTIVTDVLQYAEINVIDYSGDEDERHPDDAPSARPAHVPASVPDSEVDDYLTWYPYPGA